MTRYLIAVLMLCTPVLASAAPPDGGPAVSQEDQEKLRGQVNALGQLLGVVKPAAQPSQSPEHKTAADVAEHALTLFSGALAQVAASIEKVAPELFRVMVRQQYAKAATNLVAPLGAIIITLLAGWFLRRIWTLPKDGDDDYVAYNVIARVAPVVLALCFGIWFVVNLSDSAGYVLNPEFYAVKDLVTMVLNPGSIQ